MTASIEMEDVSFTYPDGSEALEHVSLTVEPGERIAIIGHNGAGKTTLVKLMNGLLKPTSGHVSVDGTDTEKQTTAQIARKVAYAFQNPEDQIFNQDVWSEIEFGPKNLGLEAEALERRIRQAASLCGLDALLDENPYELSASVRKFVEIASVVAMQPEVVILDEPTAGQDRDSLHLLNRIVERLSAQGRAVIVITHDMEFATGFDRCLVMADNVLVADGRAYDVLADSGLLARAGLEQPCIAALCARLGLPHTFLGSSEFADYIQDRVRAPMVPDNSDRRCAS